MRRGDTRDAVLLRLLDGPKHGYQVMSEIAELSKEQWTPGPGSIYPVVRSLAETGLVEVNEVDGRRVITLTEHGRQIAETRRDAGPAPWDRVSADDASPAMELRSAIGRLIPALKQLGREGSDAAIAEIAQRLDTLRRDAYRLLADDAPDTSEAPGATPTPTGPQLRARGTPGFPEPTTAWLPLRSPTPLPGGTDEHRACRANRRHRCRRRDRRRDEIELIEDELLVEEISIDGMCGVY
jgi:mycofactocin precursor